MLASLGTLATVAVCGMMFWMTNRIDQNERVATRDLLRVSLEDKSEKLRQTVEDYAYWTLAYELVRAGDPDDIYENIGSGATQGQLFEQIFLLDSDGTLLHAFDEIAGADAHAFFDPSAFEGLLAQLTENTAVDYVSVGGAIRNQDEMILASAAWITPDNVVTFPDANYPIMIVVSRLDEEWAASLAQKARLESLELVSDISVVGPDAPRLLSPEGTPVAAITWTKEFSGTALRNEILPAIVLLCLGMLGICGSAARYFHAQAVSLDHATEIAIKDQLTGLLNRAGLQAALMRKDISKRLAKGHLATIYVDLDKFKELNDTYGHSAGDIALKVAAERLLSVTRSSDLVARLGGDEFVCVVVDENPEHEAVNIAQKLMTLFDLPIALEGCDASLSASVGVSVARPGTQWDTLLSQSDAAMYWSKKQNAKTPILFREQLHGQAVAA